MTSYRRALPWIVWGLASVFYAYQYILRILPSVTMDEVLHRFQIDATIFGQFSGIYYLGYAGMHIPIGIMLDRIGPRKVLPLSIALIIAGLMPLLFSHSWVLACVGRLLIGMGSSAAILGVFKVVRMTFPEEKFGRMLGFSVTIGLLGAVYGGQPLNFLLTHFGMNNVLYLIITAGVVLALFIYFMVPAEKENSVLSQSILEDVKNVVSAPNVLLICLCAGLMVGPLEGFADVWGPAFLSSTYGFDKAVSSSLPSLLFIGMCFGSPLLAMAAEKSGRYYELIILSALVMAGGFIILLTGQASYGALSAILFLSGFACAYQILAIYKASTFVKESLTGLTTATANMIIMTFGYMFHSVIGKVVESTWDGSVLDGIHAYTAKSYTLGLMIIPITLGIGAAGFFLICRRSRNRGLLQQDA